jgi:maleate isomerase
MKELYNLPFETDAGIAERAAIGVIVLASDYTLEFEFRQIFDLPGVGLYQSRIFNDNTITPETLKAMDARITQASEVILPGHPLDVVAYGCTSASIVLGEEQIFKQIGKARPKAKCTTPITAAFAAFKAFGAKNIGVLTPYRADVNSLVKTYIEKAGFSVPVFASFNEEDDPTVARITTASIKAAVLEVGSHAQVDAVFVSCTSLRLATIAAEIEAELGKPVTSSNHAMAWHCLRLAGVHDKLPQFGRLFTL